MASPKIHHLSPINGTGSDSRFCEIKIPIQTLYIKNIDYFFFIEPFIYDINRSYAFRIC